MFVIQLDTKHCSGKHYRYDTFNFNMIFFHFVFSERSVEKRRILQTAKEAAKECGASRQSIPREEKEILRPIPALTATTASRSVAPAFFTRARDFRGQGF
jgi:hypothetical protein